MGFIDNIKEALGGAHDDESSSTTTSSQGAEARHVDRDAPEESEYGPQIGGKHRA